MVMKTVQRNIHELNGDGMNEKDKHCEIVLKHLPKVLLRNIF